MIAYSPKRLAWLEAIWIQGDIGCPDPKEFARAPSECRKAGLTEPAMFDPGDDLTLLGRETLKLWRNIREAK